jgi:hypothetical protein
MSHSVELLACLLACSFPLIVFVDCDSKFLKCFVIIKNLPGALLGLTVVLRITAELNKDPKLQIVLGAYVRHQ